jgi:serine/threonine protein kinase
LKKPIPFGKYLLLERINVGGMAEVFLGKAYGAEGFERLLAIKKILPTMVEDEEFITMFLDEARISVQLNHPNVVQIHELGRQDENFYIAMDYVAGKDLRTILERYRRRSEVMPTAQAAYLAQRMAEGLDYAHRKKDARGAELHIVHRDVSPQNILVSYSGEVKIIDFGIAKAANRAQKTQAGILKGKFGYMSPEQVRGLPIDRRSDIFAMGVVFFEMLTGEKLFAGESDFSTLEKVRNAEVPSPRQFNANIPPALEKVVYKALAREVEDRYQWAGEFAEDLKRILGPNGYGENQLQGFMGEAFREDVMREKTRQEAFAGMAPPVQQPEAPGSRNASSSNRAAPRPAPPVAEPASPRPTTQRPAPVAPGKKPTMVAASDPVSAALAELDGPTFMPGTPAPPAPRRSAPRKVTPPRPAVAPPESASTDYGDPNNPDIPPPSAEELAEMGTADRTVLHHPALEPEGTPAPAPRRPSLGLQSAVARGAPPVALERETFNDDRPAPRKSRAELRAAPLAAPPPPDLTRARDPEPDPDDEEATRDLGDPNDAGDTGEHADPVDARPEPVRARSPGGRGRTSEHEPTTPAPNRRRRAAPEPEPVAEPMDDPDAGSEDEQGHQDGGEHDDPDWPEPAAAPAASGRSKLPLIIGGAAGVLLFSLIAFAGYSLLSPAQSSITLTVDPPSREARVAIDGKQVPVGVEVPVLPGIHEVSFSRPGQPASSKPLKVDKGSQAKLQFKLEADDEKAAPDPVKAEPVKVEPPKTEAVKAEPPQTEPPKPEAPKPAVAEPAPKPAVVEPAPRVEPQAASKTFTLRVETEPPDAVVLFGKKKGPAPFTVEKLDRTKSYTVEARLRGYTSPAVHVKFTGDDPMRVVVTLEPKPEKAEKSERTEKPDKTEKSHAEKAEKPTPHAAKGSGTLICSSIPVAKVFVDGKSTNRFTPIPSANPLKLSAGKHTIRFEADGQSAEETVTIEPDGVKRLVGVNLH